MDTVNSLCPTCDAEIPSANIHVAEGVALCPGCGSLHRLEELAQARERVELIAAAQLPTPHGCVEIDDGRVRILTARLSPNWYIIGSCFALCMPIPIVVAFQMRDAFRGMGNSGWGTAPNPPMVSLTHWGFHPAPMLILSLLALVGVGLILASLVSTFGKVAVRIGRESTRRSGEVFLGWGPIGIRQKFDPAKVKRVGLAASKTMGVGNEPMVQVILETDGGKPVRLGGLLKGPRKRWMAAKLAQVLVHRG